MTRPRKNFDPRPYVEGRSSAHRGPLELKCFGGALMGEESPQNFLELKLSYGGRATTQSDPPFFGGRVHKKSILADFLKNGKMAILRVL